MGAHVAALASHLALPRAMGRDEPGLDGLRPAAGGAIWLLFVTCHLSRVGILPLPRSAEG